MSGRRFDAVHANHFWAMKQCPSCHETIFAAVGAERIGPAVKYHWHCDMCGQEFQSVEAIEEEAVA